MEEIMEDASLLVVNLIRAKMTGILVFLPGLEEIYQFTDIIKKRLTSLKYQNIQIIQLHSSLAFENTRKALNYTGKIQRIIIASNIAESSITIGDLKCVIDFCLTKEYFFKKDFTISKLKLNWTSKASST